MHNRRDHVHFNFCAQLDEKFHPLMLRLWVVITLVSAATEIELYTSRTSRSCMSAPILRFQLLSHTTRENVNLFFLVALQAGNQGADCVARRSRRRFWNVSIALRRPGKCSLIQASCSSAASTFLPCHCRISVLRCQAHAVSLMAASCLFVPVNGKIVVGRWWWESAGTVSLCLVIIHFAGQSGGCWMEASAKRCGHVFEGFCG